QRLHLPRRVRGAGRGHRRRLGAVPGRRRAGPGQHRPPGGAASRRRHRQRRLRLRQRRRAAPQNAPDRHRRHRRRRGDRRQLRGGPGYGGHHPHRARHQAGRLCVRGPQRGAGRKRHHRGHVGRGGQRRGGGRRHLGRPDGRRRAPAGGAGLGGGGPGPGGGGFAAGILRVRLSGPAPRGKHAHFGGPAPGARALENRGPPGEAPGHARSPAGRRRGRWSLRLLLLDRYVRRETVSPVLGLLAGVTITCVSGLLFEPAERTLIQQVAWQAVLRMLRYRLPSLIVIPLPVGTLFGVILALGRLARDGELTVIRGAGVPFWRIAVWLLVAGVAVSGLTYLLGEHVVPWTNHEYEKIIRQVIFKDPTPAE